MDGPPQTSHRERRQTGLRANGTVYESIVVADGGAGRLHSGEQHTGSTSSTETSCAQRNSSRTPESRGYAR